MMTTSGRFSIIIGTRPIAILAAMRSQAYLSVIVVTSLLPFARRIACAEARSSHSSSFFFQVMI